MARMRRIEVKYIDTPEYILNEDGEFKCQHENAEVEYDRGGDGITEPGPSYSVYCPDCQNDDMEQYEVDNIIDAYLSDREED